MKSWKTKNGWEVFQVLTGFCNVYLIIKDNDGILVDTGKKSGFQKLSKNIDSLNIANVEITFLILTHTHYDHCQSAKHIQENSNCNIVVSNTVVESIKNGYTKVPNGTIFITKLLSNLGHLIRKNSLDYDAFNPDILVEKDFDLKIGESWIRIIETPGHSKDSISILVDNEIAIVGDAMFGLFKNSIFPPYSDDIVKMIKSWKKLLGTECDIFLPGHGKEITRDLLQKEYDKYVLRYTD